MRAVSRVACRISSAALAVTLIAVPPFLLLRALGSPLALVVQAAPDDWLHPDTTDVRALMVGALASTCWIAWLRAALAFAVEACCAACRVRCPRFRLLGSMQPLAALLLGGLSVVSSQQSPSAAAAGPLAVTVRPAGVEFAWADSAFIAAGAAAAVAITRRDRRRRPLPADRMGVHEPLIDIVRPVTVAAVAESEPVPKAEAAPVLARHDLAAVRASLTRTEEVEPVLYVDRPLVMRMADVPVGDAAESRAVDESAVVRSAPIMESALLALPEWSFMVRVLGPVDVLDRSGTPVVFERTKAVEFLAWLVLHRRSATREAARTALWESDVRDASFSNVVSEARRALSRHMPSPGQPEWIARPRGELIPLHPGVVADVEVFRVHVARAEGLRRHGAEPGCIAAELRSALELVRGAPFIGSGFGWADAESTTSGCTLLVVNAALELGELELEAGRADAALSATSIGLTVLPGHEELVALRLRAHGRGGDIVAIRHEWTAYVRSLANDPWQSEPSPWLEDLVRELVAEPATAG